ncbi:Methenyltetrahydrofolate synthase domain-containing protein [Bagarius yarrelli]|uniref:Dynein regulatory complex subunit 4 n=1 Tax=Bagarius yarrelli TaxID=175774 RepID=A0A556V8T0_BAGYA|nr:Methenyltetrahydrofolate synthase domain-containing protein [Bagarius yarrelli]
MTLKFSTDPERRAVPYPVPLPPPVPPSSKANCLQKRHKVWKGIFYKGQELKTHLGAELDQERERSNNAQLERDQIYTLWVNTKEQLEEKKAEIRNKEQEIEESEENHQTEIRAYKQKVKHLLYEQQISIAALKTKEEVANKNLEKIQADLEKNLKKHKWSLKGEGKENQRSSGNDIKNLLLSQKKEINNLTAEFERQLREMEATYEQKMQKQRQELDLRRKTEIHEVEQRKSIHINTLIKNHEKVFNDGRNYYNNIMIGNVNQICSLKEDLSELKKKKDQLMKKIAEVQEQNQILTEPLQKTTQEMFELQRQLTNYKQDKVLLAGVKAQLKDTDKQQKIQTRENEVMTQELKKVQQERDELYQKFTQTIQQVHHKCEMKNLLLERKMDVLTDTLEEKETQMNEIITACNLEPSALNRVTRNVEELLDSKNITIKDLQFELARVSKATKWDIRQLVWDYIETKDLATFPRPVHHRIPNFKEFSSSTVVKVNPDKPQERVRFHVLRGSQSACGKIIGLDFFTKCIELKVDPDKPLEGARLAALQAGKTLLVPTPRLRTGLFNRIVPPPRASKEDLRVCATSRGVKEFRKGEGFADMEYAMMVSMGAVNESTVVVTVVHDCQVVEIPEGLTESHDLIVDYILTPSRIIKTECKIIKPQGIIWSKLDTEMLEKIPILKKLRVLEQKAGKDVNLKVSFDERVRTKREHNPKPCLHTEPDQRQDIKPLLSSSGQKPDVRCEVSPASVNTLYLRDLPAGLRVSELKVFLRERNAVPVRLTWQGAQHTAFLQYADEQTSDQALDALKGFCINGHTIHVERANSQRRFRRPGAPKQILKEQLRLQHLPQPVSAASQTRGWRKNPGKVTGGEISGEEFGH